MKLNTRLTLASIITIIIIASGALFIVQNQIKDKLIKEVQSNTERGVENTFKIVNLYFNVAEERFNKLSSDPDIIRALETLDQDDLRMASDVLTATQKSKVIFEGIGLHDMRGISVAADEFSKKVIGINFSERDYHEGVMSTKSNYISSSFRSAATGNLVVAVAAPVKNENNEMIGYLIGAVDLQFLEDTLKEESESEHTILLDRYENIFLNTREESHEEDEKEDGEEEVVQAIVRRLQDGEKEGFLEHYSFSENKFEYLGFRKYDSFTVALDKDKSTALAILDDIDRTLIIATIMIILLVTTATSITSRSVSKPIKKLTDDVEKITRGNFEIKLEPSSIDEIQGLTDSLNRVLTSMKLAIMRTGKISEEKKESPEKIFVKKIKRS